MKISENFGEYIKLSQWLKKENIISSGGEAREFIENGNVTLNGMQVHEIRKKLHDGDTVVICGKDEYKIVVKPQ